jgi:hypothetical protein
LDRVYLHLCRSRAYEHYQPQHEFVPTFDLTEPTANDELVDYLASCYRRWPWLRPRHRIACSDGQNQPLAPPQALAAE